MIPLVLAADAPKAPPAKKEYGPAVWKSALMMGLLLLVIGVGIFILHRIRKYMKEEEMI